MYAFQLLLLLAVIASTLSIPCYQGDVDTSLILDNCPSNSSMCYKKAVYTGDTFKETVGCDLAVYCEGVALTTSCAHALGKSGICCCKAEGFCNQPTGGVQQSGFLVATAVFVSSFMYSF